MLSILLAIGCWMLFLGFAWTLFAVSARADAETTRRFGPRFSAPDASARRTG